METPERLKKMDEPNNNRNGDAAATASTSSKGMDSPKTPTQATFDDSFDDEDSDEMESPKFPHLIPIYHRRDDDYDLRDVRIGWDDGYGSVFFDDDDYDTYRNGKRRRRSKNGRFFTDHHHRSKHRRNQFCDNSPSPISNPPVNNAAIQAELNDYLACILSCLSAKKRDRQLLKAKKEASMAANNSLETNNVKSLLDDSADDELMLLCTQDVERTIANDDASCKNIKETKHVKKFDYLSIGGITPLKDTNVNTNNNEYYHVSKKFKPIYGKKNENLRSPCHTITSNMEKNEKKNKAENHNKDCSISLFNDSLANEDDLFSSIDLSEIEQQISSDNKTTSASVTQKCNAQQHNTHIRKQYENKPACSTSTITSNSSSVLWRRSTSSSFINKQSQLQDKKSFCDVPSTQINPSSGCTKTTGTRYCTPAEIEEKRNRARRTLLLKFKSKNKTIS